MNRNAWQLLLILILASSCQSARPVAIVFVNGHTFSLPMVDRVPAHILAKTGKTLGANDCIYYLGSPVSRSTPLPEASTYTLSLRDAATLTLVSPDGQKSIQTCAQTVGQALTESGYILHSADRLDPPAEIPIRNNLTVKYQPSKMIDITIAGTQAQVRSTASTVGQSLAEAGIPLMGLDFSVPPENAPLPTDGKINVSRVSETVTLTERDIPFSTRTEPSADVEIDQEALLQGGEPGLATIRVRLRNENGIRVSQRTEKETIVRPPQDRILGYGTKIVVHTATFGTDTFQYYRVLNLYATSYSPCRSATPSGKCSYGTSSGLPVQRGTVAMVYSWYLAFGFDQLYIPGYGYATVGDVGGGPPGNHYWIDLAFSDADWRPYSGTVTVYFLTPVPKQPVYLLP